VLVTGARDWHAVLPIYSAMLVVVGVGRHTLIHGDAEGADRIAAVCALALGWAIDQPVHVNPPFGGYAADWRTHGRPAGPIRNQRMLVEGKPDLVLAFHDDIRKSRGTRDMVLRALRAGVTVRLFFSNGEEGDPRVLLPPRQTTFD